MGYQWGATARADGLLLLNWEREGACPVIDGCRVGGSTLGLVASETESRLACLKLACARRTRAGEDMMVGGWVDGGREWARSLFMRRPAGLITDVTLQHNRLIGAISLLSFTSMAADFWSSSH